MFQLPLPCLALPRELSIKIEGSSDAVCLTAATKERFPVLAQRSWTTATSHSVFQIPTMHMVICCLPLPYTADLRQCSMKTTSQLEL
ncbi:hypothetical protein HOLleu_31786 [Holothuria leucospilota]|uniref:Uncharacterized protein n=1 Tax=Holothuria leucospilota TaxID=206669 RepID=A0A9Q0YSJ4_HOLLE|nr:hypothetical protein HOLleu_31786 [Holothuria leucospilota]